MAETRKPVAPGESAPDFKLPAVDRPETVSLADYRGRSSVFLALLIGLWYPFCRRQIALMGPLASDPQLTTHRAYGLPKPAPTPEFMGALQATRFNPFGDLPEPLPVMQAAMAISNADGYPATATDEAERDRQFPQLKGLFMIDRDGGVRWSYVECGGPGWRREDSLGRGDRRSSAFAGGVRLASGREGT